MSSGILSSTKDPFLVFGGNDRLHGLQVFPTPYFLPGFAAISSQPIGMIAARETQVIIPGQRYAVPTSLIAYMELSQLGP
jgi:hypothetical protein